MNIYTDNINKEDIRKALFVISTKGSTLSKEVQKVIKQNADEFEKIVKG